MKEITMFLLPNCPHCRRALAMIDELVAAEPKFRDVPIKKIDESAEPELANSYDYYLVPTFYVGGEKLHEGVPTEEAVRRVFEAAAG